MASPRDAMITGIGLVSCLGEGIEAHWSALNRDGGFVPVIDATTFAPWPTHPMASLDLDKQIPKRGDQRQMEAWQRIGTYAAGLALDSACVKGNADLLSRMDMIVAAGGGERDYAVDTAILSALPSASDPGTFLNERLLSDLRPTLFLAQLSNLLAGNISIVHGVVGSSRTFMGEEASGADAVRVACARIAAGQGDLFLVGGSYNAQRPDILLHYEMGGLLWKQPIAGVWARQAAGGGMVLGSAGLFPGDRESRARLQARYARYGTHKRARHRSVSAPLGRGNRDHGTAACDDAPSSAATACRGDFRRHRCCRGHRRRDDVPGRSRTTGARHGDRIRPLAGAVISRQSSAGGIVAVAPPAVRATRT